MDDGGVELLLEELDSDGLDDGGEELASGVVEPGVELGLPGAAVEEPDEAAPGLEGVDGVVEAPEDEEEDGGVLLVPLLVLDSLLQPTSAATTAAAQQIFARLPKVWSM